MCISQAIAKLCHLVTGVVSTPRRIVQDCNRVLTSAVAIVRAGGKIVPGLVNRNGHRNKPESDGRKYHPQKRNQVIKTMDEMGIFSCVQKIAMESIEAEVERFNNRIN
jgi:hypothetical protein